MARVDSQLQLLVVRSPARTSAVALAYYSAVKAALHALLLRLKFSAFLLHALSCALHTGRF